ncbi:uncharacterized protein [Drosophila virilis]|uniref:Uncharacterized protein, isoform B n=1 Tax=Drosophila virilis TaxID=7244 RepID=A0A0Q9W577_DROVI|nr:uncharacterized protein LOC26531720 [Drosophila virilis]KRF80120.1 uncharacterized protein Dvir_GJ26950, isoform B [Drosophila virilis]
MSGQKSRGQTNAAMQILARIKRQRTHIPPDQATSRPGDRSTCPSVLVAFFGQHVMERQPQSHFTGSDVCGQMKGRTNGRAQFRQRQTEMNMPMVAKMARAQCQMKNDQNEFGIANCGNESVNYQDRYKSYINDPWQQTINFYTNVIHQLSTSTGEISNIAETDI